MAIFCEETGDAIFRFGWTEVERMCPFLTKEQCFDVLKQYVWDYCNYNEGISWDAIRACAEDLYGNKKETK